MKKVILMTALASALVLSACGGDSDSSGSHSSSFYKTLTNKNKYSCPSEAAVAECTTDSMCKVAKCELIEKNTTPSDTTTTTNCKVSGKTVTGYNGKSCKFENSGAKANMVITCTSGKMQLDGNIGGFNSNGGTNTSGSRIGGYVLQCP